MSATAKEVVEAIDCAIEACRFFDIYEATHAGEFQGGGTLGEYLKAIAVLTAHRSSLLEKGGPDAVGVDRRVDEFGANQGAGQGEQMDVAQSSSAPASVTVGRRAPRFSHKERKALRLKAMLGDDTPGGRT